MPDDRAMPCMQDLRRIKQEGPRLEDITKAYPFTLTKEDGTKFEVTYTYVPKDVITAAGQYVGAEPDWNVLPQMPFMQFYQVWGSRPLQLAARRTWRPLSPCVTLVQHAEYGHLH